MKTEATGTSSLPFTLCLLPFAFILSILSILFEFASGSLAGLVCLATLKFLSLRPCAVLLAIEHDVVYEASLAEVGGDGDEYRPIIQLV